MNYGRTYVELVLYLVLVVGFKSINYFILTDWYIWDVRQFLWAEGHFTSEDAASEAMPPRQSERFLVEFCASKRGQGRSFQWCANDLHFVSQALGIWLEKWLFSYQTVNASLRCTQLYGTTMMDKVNCTETVELMPLSGSLDMAQTSTISTLTLLRTLDGIQVDSGGVRRQKWVNMTRICHISDDI